MVTIQSKNFSIEHISNKVSGNNSNVGAVVLFVGYVRDFDKKDSKHLINMNLEHYPGMTEKVLEGIEEKAKQRWSLSAVEIVHRVGKLKPSDPIVCVAVASQHRDNAFDAARFIIDFLKTEAPFWKKELTDQGSYWVDEKESDHKQKMSWDIAKEND